MSTHFTEKAKDALNGSKDIAQDFGHTHIGTEHLLLSLVRVGACCSSVILQRNGFSEDKIAAAIEQLCPKASPKILSADVMTPKMRRCIENAGKISFCSFGTGIGTEHLLYAILEENDSAAIRVLRIVSPDLSALREDVLSFIKNSERSASSAHGATPMLTQYGRNMIEEAKTGKYDACIGREKEVDRLCLVLCRKSKNNPCLIGDAGVGKTAIVEGFASRLAEGNVPPSLLGKVVYSVDLSSMVAGTKYRGDFEERIKSLMSEAEKDPNIILFIDEIHNIVGAGSAEGAIDASNIIKPQLARKGIRLIGATTPEEYRKYIEKDAALERRFQPIQVSEPTEEAAKRILTGIRPALERHHGIRIGEDAIESAVKLSVRYLPDRRLPDKAIDLLDEAGAKFSVRRKNSSKLKDKEIRQAELKNEESEETLVKYWQSLSQNGNPPSDTPLLTKECVEEVVSEWSGIPIGRLGMDILRPGAKMRLKAEIFGQDAAIERIINALKRRKSGLSDPDRPIGTFLFLGKSGVGKTELAKALAKELFGRADALLRLDMSEYAEPNSVSKMIGCAPGYVGFDEGKNLCEKIRLHPFSVVLFDEIEKAHPEVLSLLLQLCEEGELTESNGRKVSFRNACVLLTSNVGSDGLSRANTPGFSIGEKGEKDCYEKLKSYFPDELVNRMDEIILFSPLSDEELVRVAAREISAIKKRAKIAGYDVKVPQEAAKMIVDSVKTNEFGARSVKRAVVTLFETVLADYLCSHAPDPDSSLVFTMKDGTGRIYAKKSRTD